MTTPINDLSGRFTSCLDALPTIDRPPTRLHLVGASLPSLLSARQRGHSYERLASVFFDNTRLTISPKTLERYIQRLLKQPNSQNAPQPSQSRLLPQTSAKTRSLSPQKSQNSDCTENSPSQETQQPILSDQVPIPLNANSNGKTATNPLLTLKRTDYPELYADYEDTNP